MLAAGWVHRALSGSPGPSTLHPATHAQALACWPTFGRAAAGRDGRQWGTVGVGSSRVALAKYRPRGLTVPAGRAGRPAPTPTHDGGSLARASTAATRPAATRRSHPDAGGGG